MAKKRLKEHLGWPAGWRLKNGYIRYRVPVAERQNWNNQSEFKLGRTATEAYRTWTERLELINHAPIAVLTISDLIDRFLMEISAQKPPRNYHRDIKLAKPLRIAFGHFPIDTVRPIDVRQYIEARANLAKQPQPDGIKRGGYEAGARETRFFSSVMTHAVDWGLIENHPFKGHIRFKKPKRSTRYVTNEEKAKFDSVIPKHSRNNFALLKAYLEFKDITALRKQDILVMKLDQLQDDGIHVTPLKTRDTSGKRLIIEWTDALRESVEDIRTIRPNKASEFLFCMSDGRPFYDEQAIVPGRSFDNTFKTMMKRAMNEAGLDKKFTDHDMRARAASTLDLPHAQALLGHTSKRLTDEYYRRLPDRVKPTR